MSQPRTVPFPVASTPLHADEYDGLSGQVVSHVRRWIASQGLGAGDLLPGELELSRTLGVSRTVVREASHTLAAVGLLDVAPGRRPRVGRMKGVVLQHYFEDALITGQAKAQQILEVRRGLEIEMAALAARRCPPDTLACLEVLLAEMSSSLEVPRVYVELDMRFHRTLAQAADNPFYVVLADACRNAFETSMDVGLRARLSSLELDEVQRLHAEIVGAVRAKNPVTAADAMARHFDDALAALHRTTGL